MCINVHHCASLCITGHHWAFVGSDAIHPSATSISTASERKKELQEENLEIFLIVVTQEHCIQVAFGAQQFFLFPAQVQTRWFIASVGVLLPADLLSNHFDFESLYFLSWKIMKLQITPLVSVSKNNFHPDEHLVYHRWFLGRDDLSVQWALLAGFPSCCQNQKIYLRHIQTISRHGCRSIFTLSLFMLFFFHFQNFNFLHF